MATTIPLLSNDRRYMRLALDLARKGRGRVAPNPMVGCVIVKEGVIVGRGFHEYFGGPHAEVNALKDAGRKAKGATLYVTLEPCAHWGKTPPCTDAIIKAGIARVVAALSDPNPRICGKGFAKLANHHIATVSGVLKKEAGRLNGSYFRALVRRRTHVTVKMAMSLDGKIATRIGESKWITSARSRDLVHRLRSTADGIVVGITTVLRDDPELTSHGKGRNPVRIVIDPGLKIPLRSRVLDRQAPTLVIYRIPVKEKLEALKKRGVILVNLPGANGKIEFGEIVKKLSELSISNIVIEGGGETVAAALEAGVVDEMLIFIAPKIIGGRDATSPVEGNGIARMAEALNIKSWEIKRSGADLMIRAIVQYREDGRR